MHTKKILRIAGLLLGLPLFLPSVHANPFDSQQALNVPPKPVIGQRDEATADLLVSHPKTTPCIVPLFQSDSFDNYAPRPFNYAPPAACPPPWAKVVFVGNFSETSGRQFDRTAYLFLGNANLYFGTTPEPRHNLGPTWNIEKDVTDYSALLAQPQSGAMTIFNIVNNTYTGVIHGSGYLYFYPYSQGGDHSQADPRKADVPSAVFPLNSGNQPAYLPATSSLLSQQFTFPTNMTQMYVDIVAQSQIGDEFWYSCVPDQYESELQSCGGTGYRQAVVQVDGKAMAYAPVSPWIYTGGIDPDLWGPTPGAQTLNFKAYRVNLTPLVAELDDGQPHTISVSVYNSSNYFSVAASVLVYQDPRADQITGGVTAVDVPALSPQTTDDLVVDNSGDVSGSLTVSSDVRTHLSGYVNLPDGRQNTTVDQDLQFANAQTFTINSATYDQDIVLTNPVKTVTQISGPGGESRTFVRNWSFPLNLNYQFFQDSNGNYDIATTVEQDYRNKLDLPLGGQSSVAEKNDVKAQDTLILSPSFSIVGNSGMTSSQHFEFQSNGWGRPLCYNRTIENANSVVDAVTDAATCDLLPASDDQGD